MSIHDNDRKARMGDLDAIKKQMDRDFKSHSFIIFGHIELERALREYIYATLKKSVNHEIDKGVSGKGMLSTFQRVVEMAKHLRLIENDDYAWMNAFNNMRNNIAHKSGYQPSESDYKHINNNLPVMHHKAGHKPSEKDILKMSITAMYFVLKLKSRQLLKEVAIDTSEPN